MQQRVAEKFLNSNYMFELVYHSIAKPGITNDEIASLLHKAREFNSANNITGCLLHHNNEFLQILEGKKEAIQDLFLSISKDSRHSHAYLIIEGEKKERTFPKWSMAYNDFKVNYLSKVDSLSDTTNKPSVAIDLFYEMSRQILSK